MALLVVLFVLSIFCSDWTKATRKVAMIADVCQRFPKLEFCRSFPPTVPPMSDKQPLDRETYCKKYQLHYTYFCTTDENQVERSKEFCQSYNAKCDTKEAPGIWSDEQIKEQCTKRKSLAEQYCTGNEAAAIKPDCDLYRKYCLNQGTPSVTTQPIKDNGAVDMNQYCKSNYDRYQSICLRQLAQPQQVQPQPNPQNAAAGYSPEQIKRLCDENRSLATVACKGNEKNPDIRQKCDLYRQYCVGGGILRQKRQGLSNGLSGTPNRSDAFCQEFSQNCNNLAWQADQNSQLAVFCQQYSFTRDTFCPAYEIAENRISCNAYRYYCQGKTPFRDIDGVTGN